MSGFVHFARAHGLEINELHPSEKIQRCGTTDKPRSKNGAFYFDGDRGWIWNWSGEARVQWYEDPHAKPWSDEEKRAWAMRRQTMAQEQQRKHENAALRAQVMLRSAVPGPHDYLIRKGLAAIDGLVSPEGALLVPMRSVDTNEVKGVQVIQWLPEELSWEKKMASGMQAKGAVFCIGPRSARETFLCEGYATGLSIELAARQLRLNASVLVCFSDSNMVHVASLLAKKPGRRFVFADNDKSEAGERAAKATGLPYCMADVEGFDANDVHAKHGLMAVQKMLMKLRSG